MGVIEMAKNDVKTIVMPHAYVGDGFVAKTIKNAFNQCEMCGNGVYHTYVIKCGVKTIGTITFCPKCHGIAMYGFKHMPKPLELANIDKFMLEMDAIIKTM